MQMQEDCAYKCLQKAAGTNIRQVLNHTYFYLNI